MTWTVLLHDEFSNEIDDLSTEVKEKLFMYAGQLEEFGWSLERPRFATLKGSKINNLKEIRFDADGGVWRVLYAFDPKRQCIILVAGDKSGVNQNKFYKKIIKKAERRYSQHLLTLEKK